MNSPLDPGANAPDEMQNEQAQIDDLSNANDEADSAQNRDPLSETQAFTESDTDLTTVANVDRFQGETEQGSSSKSILDEEQKGAASVSTTKTGLLQINGPRNRTPGAPRKKDGPRHPVQIAEIPPLPPRSPNTVESSSNDATKTDPQTADSKTVGDEETTAKVAEQPTSKTTKSKSAGTGSRRFSDELLCDCEATIQYTFNDRKVLEQSLTHASISRTRLASNERLEFLGDSIMGAAVCEFLFQKFPDFPEGELTRIKSSVVSRHTCSQISESMNFGRFLALGKGLAVHNRIPVSIMAAAFESVVAAIYLDGGWEAAQEFVIRMLKDEIVKASKSAHSFNFKSMLQQHAQKSLGATPVYRLLDEKGPDHAKSFQVSAAIGDRLFQPAWGSSKKEAEQNAANNALGELNAQKSAPSNPPSSSDERPAANADAAIEADPQQSEGQQSERPLDDESEMQAE